MDILKGECVHNPRMDGWVLTLGLVKKKLDKMLTRSHLLIVYHQANLQLCTSCVILGVVRL